MADSTTRWPRFLRPDPLPLALLAVLAVAPLPTLAAGTAPSQGPAAGDAVPHETLVSQAYSGIESPLREVIREPAAWEDLWRRIHAGTSPVPPPPPVDFEREMLVVAALGTRMSGGFGISVTRVIAGEEGLRVTLRESCPPPGAMVTMALVQPVQVIRVPRADQPVVFELERAPECDPGPGQPRPGL